MNILETNTCKIEFSGTIINIIILEGAEFNLENTIADRKAQKELVQNKKVCVLIDGNNNFSVEPDGLNYAASPEANINRKAVAFFSDSPAMRLKANFFKKHSKPPIPYEVFKTKEEAENWLNQFL